MLARCGGVAFNFHKNIKKVEDPKELGYEAESRELCEDAGLKRSGTFVSEPKKGVGVWVLPWPNPRGLGLGGGSVSGLKGVRGWVHVMTQGGLSLGTFVFEPKTGWGLGSNPKGFGCQIGWVGLGDGFMLRPKGFWVFSSANPKGFGLGSESGVWTQRGLGWVQSPESGPKGVGFGSFPICNPNGLGPKRVGGWPDLKGWVWDEVLDPKEFGCRSFPIHTPNGLGWYWSSEPRGFRSGSF
ncbi:hypothetical protein NC653_001979 [Populus alba x Populus x berolinensis]|uniref:Uncharacterized protein n=1 Tax=Populus alba x Populus x berolinensis TaxID=444605 RepID=A0AAD6RMX1_9ROSI|nr:hypothetical protein NC653_001979 [Populus alba x Populus x berolinensis]